VITKAIIPVAGWGTRRLPITKALEKCMLPIGNRPIVDYIVEDCLRAGITDIYFVVNESSTQIQAYYKPNIQLNDYLINHRKEDKLPLVTPPSGATFHFIVQPNTGGYGTSIPVSLADTYINDDESALVIMGDQFFLRKDDGSNAADLIALVESSNMTAGLFGVPVPKEDVSKYGIIEKDASDKFVRIVEKPTLEEAPSNLNNASFYVFDKDIFKLARTLPINPVRNEFEVTDAINTYVANGKDIIVGEARGEYLEAGSLEGWLHANRAVFGEY
jgi:UTP--glucose-1-phosphate uridylyltransferase